MVSIQTQLNKIKDIMAKEDTININTIIYLYYQMLNNHKFVYSDKYLNIDTNEAIKTIIKIGDINFIPYFLKKLYNYSYILESIENNKKISKIIEGVIEYYIENNDIDNLNNIHQVINKEGIETINTIYYIINSCIILNNYKILKMFLLNPNNNFEETEPDEFKYYICSHIMFRGDLVEIIKVFHEYSIKFPNFINFDFNLVFNAALVNGREKCMEYAINNGKIEYHYEDNKYGYTTVEKIFPFTDSIMYAIIGKNINCVKMVFELFKNKINNNWYEYFKFASVYGTLEIIQYMLKIKQNIELNNDFYNNILKFALCNGNIDIVKFAYNNGAIYSNDIHDFIEDYNDSRGPASAVDEDYIDFYMNKYTLPENFNEKYFECMKFIHNN